MNGARSIMKSVSECEATIDFDRFRIGNEGEMFMSNRRPSDKLILVRSLFLRSKV